ncbi:1-acyl-sn-glycerol-3-phosphate acyltransferase [Tianweitania sediminis]|uniref:1-acyl-sn-glycerol-3-phosphate acyltransferase n=1 Tax=Tianweitania sediminis TaxID=1502156 RepID=A0A8J7R0D7_9HYPH|nr:1-acyl-sn-glycerol-3-phosphate acyltransferase [Tianweitania sediminis]MBP0437641.1 1-acyl-sn-glycerol-3-phosphate acyltransferase [Tianweitania sediminis]
MTVRPSVTTEVGNFSGELYGASDVRHIVDQLIDERTTNLSRHPLWPVAKPVLFRLMHYHQAVRMADRIAPMPGWDALEFISQFLQLDLTVRGLENIPASGGFILAPSHPTGIADGIAVFDLLKKVRRDIAIFANRDAERVAPQFRDVIIPVEWRAGEKSHAKSRDTLEMTARAFGEQRAVVLFPAGRIAFWNEGRLTERPWQPSFVALARRYKFPVVPVNIAARNSGLFYFLSKHSTELRDMTLFRELLNKKGMKFTFHVGQPIDPDRLGGDPAELTAKLQDFTVETLKADPEAIFI